MRRFVVLFLAATFAAALSLRAEFESRYPKLRGYAHHVYVDGFDMPVLNAGPSDPAPHPDGRSVVLAARGWLWRLDLETRTARRLTRGRELDSRPAVSPDGSRIAFVRDDGRDTRIMGQDLATGAEIVLVDTKALDLDPVFSRDGSLLYWSSAEAGDLDLWALDLATSARSRLTTDEGNELSAQPLGGNAVAFVHKRRGASDDIVVLDTESRDRGVLREEWIGSNLRPAASPGGHLLAATLPDGPRARMLLLDVAGGATVELAHGAARPLMPAFAPDGQSLYFVDADTEQRFHLMRTPVGGGSSEDVSPRAWDWGDPVARLTVSTRLAPASPGQGGARPVAARLSIVDGQGHPAIPETGGPRFDSQNGVVYFFSDGVATVELPRGEARVTAAHGLAAPVVSRSVAVGAEGAAATLDLQPLWDAAAEGWYSGDHHWHLNYGGPYPLRPQDVLTELRAEALDVATPQVANLHQRFMDLEWWGWRRLGEGPPLVAFAQEVRSHFLGHLGLVGTATPFWPWYWGPGYSVYGSDDRENADALRHARREGGIGVYVHPVRPSDPFPKEGAPGGIPLELVPDAVLGDLDGLEVACLWSDETGTSELWYRLLNLGLPIAPTAGTDAMPNFFRMMAVGTTRVYVRTQGPLTFERYLDGLRAGRSFVTNGPLPRFTVGGVGPGEVLVRASGGGAAPSVPFTLTVSSASPFARVEVVVNGRVAWSAPGRVEPGTQTWTGVVPAPAGGWIAARAVGGETHWPAMDSYPFAHTAPVWMGQRGSRDPTAAREAARDLLRWLDEADRELAKGYGQAEIPKLRARFAEARRRLEDAARSR